MNKTIHIKRVLDITLSVPMDETQEQTEQWLDDNLIPDCSLEKVDADHVIKDIRLAGNDDDQDDFLVVEWPESQELMEYEGFMDNCTLILSDGFGSASYMVNKNWYSQLRNDELKKTEYEDAA
jgi:hypothetical protein